MQCGTSKFKRNSAAAAAAPRKISARIQGRSYVHGIFARDILFFFSAGLTKRMDAMLCS
jgi:hypothetical protein